MNEYRRQIEENDQQNEGIKKRMQNILSENQHLNDEVRNAQENLRLSSAQQAKLNRELNEYKQKIEDNNR